MIFDINGREVVELIDRQLTAGYHHVIWNGKDKLGIQVSSGIYFYRIIARATDGSEKLVRTKKMIFAK